MVPTPLQDALGPQTVNVARPRDVSGYRGAITATRFADPQQEFSALLNGCGIYDLGFRARISLSGGDRVRWMNGMVTNNIRDLAVGHGVYAFLLNPQGRILGDMQVYNRGESLLVETDRSQVEKVIATFDHFIIMDDVELVNISENQTALGLAGPRSRELLNAVGIAVPEMEPSQVMTPQCACECDCLECTVIRGEDAPRESYEIWLDPKDVYKTWQALISAGATPVGSEALEMQRITAGIPLYGTDIRERDLPQETEQMRALNFNKGCYVGQEIVERIRAQGHVNKKLVRLEVDGAEPLAAGTRLKAGDADAGEITSAVYSPRSGKVAAMGYVRTAFAEAGTPVQAGEVDARVV